MQLFDQQRSCPSVAAATRTCRSRWNPLVTALVVACAAWAMPAWAQLKFTDLGRTVPSSISADGNTVVGWWSDSTVSGFRWRPDTGVVDVRQIPGGSDFTPSGISRDGTTIVGRSSSSAAVIWREGAGTQSIGGLPGSYTSTATAASTDGQTIVGISNIGTPSQYYRRAWRWTSADGFKQLARAKGEGTTGTTETSAIGRADSPSVGSSDNIACYWLANGSVKLVGPDNGVASTISATSLGGNYLYGRYGNTISTYRGFLWFANSGGWVLNDSYGSSAFLGCNPAGDIAVGWFTPTGSGVSNMRAMLWTEHHGPRDLNALAREQGLALGNWVLTRVYDISADGRTVVGVGMVNGESRGFRLSGIDIGPRLASVSVDKSEVVGGESVSITITLDRPATGTGAVVQLWSGNIAMPLPSTITFRPGEQSQVLRAKTYPVSMETTVTISASQYGTTVSTPLRVMVPTPQVLYIHPSSVKAGGKARANVTLNGSAASGGVVLNLSSSRFEAVVPGSVTVPAGSDSVGFDIQTTAVQETVSVKIQAASGQTTTSANLEIVPALLESFQINPSSVKGSNSAEGVVTLDVPAATNGAVVKLSSSSASAIVPAGIKVAAGAKSMSFPISTTYVTQTETVSITATAGGVAKTAVLVITPTPIPLRLVITPPKLKGGTVGTGTVVLNALALAGGLTVDLKSDRPELATVPSRLLIPPGAVSADFPIQTTAVSNESFAIVEASAIGVTLSANVTVLPPRLQSVAVDPASVTGGNSTAATVLLDGIAPTGGTIVTLASANASAIVPPSVTIDAGANQARFTVGTSAVQLLVNAALTATLSGESKNTTVQITPGPAPVRLAFTPGSVRGGDPSTGTVTLNGPAPTGGTVVRLQSSVSQATVPSSVTVAAGATSASFTVQTKTVTSLVNAQVTANAGGLALPATLQITTSPAAFRLVLNPTDLKGGAACTGTILLNAVAPSGGVVVTLKSSDTTVATVPSSVIVPAGSTSVDFGVAAKILANSAAATVTATAGGVTRTADVIVRPWYVASVEVDPTSVRAGSGAKVKVTLDMTAPVGGVVVQLRSDHPSVVLPSSITVPQGAISATADVTTRTVAAVVRVQVKASAGDAKEQENTLTVYPVVVASLTLDPASVVGGATATGTVALDADAPPGGVTVALASSSNAATVRASVLVSAGSRIATFTVSTVPVATPTTGEIRATAGDVSVSAKLTIAPPVAESLSVNPSLVTGGFASEGTVTLTGAAPNGGIVVTLTSSDPSAAVPESVTVLAGETSAKFPIATMVVSKLIEVTISASAGGVSQSAILKVNSPTIAMLRLNPRILYGAGTSTGEVVLDIAAPAGGVLVSLASSRSVATVPPSVLVPAGSESATFTVTAVAVPTTTTVSISGTASGFTRGDTLTLRGPDLEAFAITPPSVVGGASTAGVVTIDRIAPAGGVRIALSTTNTKVTIPSSVTVPEGSRSASFPIKTGIFTSLDKTLSVTATIKATLAGRTYSAALEITAFPIVIQIVLEPSSLVGGTAGTGWVVLNGTEPSKETTVNLASSLPSVAKVPGQIIFPVGVTKVSFPITTFSVSSVTSVDLTARSLLPPTVSSTLTVTSSAAVFDLKLDAVRVKERSRCTGTIVLNAPAPSTGTTVSVGSSDTAVATVPQSVTVPAGKTTVDFEVTTLALGAEKSVTITASAGGVSKQATLWVDPVRPRSLVLNPESVKGGSVSTGTVHLDAPAPPGGVVVALTRSSATATLPVSVTVEAGAMAASFTVSTAPVVSGELIKITARAGGIGQTANLEVLPLLLDSLTLSPATIKGGAAATGTVQLDGPAPTGGTVVKLKSSSVNAVVPESVTVAAGATSATFPIETKPVANTESVTITASAGIEKTATITLTAPALTGLSVSPATVKGGTASTGKVAIDAVAPEGGLVVHLSSSGAAATVAATVTISAGANSATFPIETRPVAVSTTATITATWGGNSRSANLKVTAPLLGTLSLNPTSVPGGGSSTGTARLDGPAPSGGVSVALTASSTVASVPATVTIPAGETAVTFTVATTTVATVQTVTIKGVAGGATKSASLQVSPGTVPTALTLKPTFVRGGKPATGTVTVNAPAPAGGAVVALQSNTPSAAVPASVTVPAGATTVNFVITTTGVSAEQVATITATSGSVSKSATLKVMVPAPSAISVNPVSVVGGTTATGTITLDGAGPVDIALASSHAAVGVPASISVPAGATRVTFAVTTKAVETANAATITATSGGTSKSTVLTVTSGPAPRSLVLSPKTVSGGGSSTATVTLNAPAPAGGLVVTLSSSASNVANVSASVTVPSGAVSAKFTVKTTAPAASQNVTIAATANGVSASAILTVTK